MSVSIRFVAIAAGAAALAFSVGCGQPPEEKSAAEPQAQAPSKTPRSPAPSDQVVTPNLVKSTELPANFPEDVPQHPEATVIESRVTGDLGMSVVMVVQDDTSAVASYYADSLASEGWLTDIRNTPEGTAVFADKGKRTAGVLVTEGRRGAEVTLILGYR